jgi:hypothetical protein
VAGPHGLLGRDGEPRVGLRRVPYDEHQAPAGLEHAPRLAQGRLGIQGQHVAEAAEDAVDRRGGLVDPLELHRPVFRALDAQRLAAPSSRLDHRLGTVGDDEATARLQADGGGERGVAASGGQLEHRLTRPRVEPVDHPAAYRLGAGIEEFGLALPGRRGLLPPIAALCALLVGVHGLPT